MSEQHTNPVSPHPPPAGRAGAGGPDPLAARAENLPQRITILRKATRRTAAPRTTPLRGTTPRNASLLTSSQRNTSHHRTSLRLTTRLCAPSRSTPQHITPPHHSSPLAATPHTAARCPAAQHHASRLITAPRNAPPAMTKPLTVVLLGVPTPFARMRLGRGHHFVPPHQRNAAAALRLAAEQAMRQQGAALIDEPVRMDLLAEFPVPPSWSKRKRAAALLGLHSPARPDIDNVYKLAADALTGIVYRDDALVADLHCRKIYGVQPKLVVTVRPLLRPAAELPLSEAAA